MAEWSEVLAAVGVALGGDKVQGRQLLTACWDSTTVDDHAQRCLLAHYLADVQEALDDEIGWDETALHEHGFLREDELAPVGIPSAQGLLPSLHLNLGDGYLRRGNGAAAHKHQQAGEEHVRHLPDDGYGRMIRAGLENLGQRIASGA